MKKISNLVLILCLILTLLPVSIMGEEIEEGSGSEVIVPVNETESNPIIEEKLTNNRVVKEAKEKRTANSKHYLLEDGSYQAVISMGDVHYEDENGILQDIRIDLIDEADIDLADVLLSKESALEAKLIKNENIEKRKNNQIDKSQTNYRALQVPYNVKISKEFSKGYSIGKGTDKLTFIPIGASSVTGDVYNSSTIRYNDAWFDTDVTLALTDQGIKETMILNSPSAPTLFTFEVKGNLGDDLKSDKMQLLPAWLEDVNGEYRDVEQIVRREGNKTYVDLIADVSGLAYPIEIDPTVTLQPDATEGKDAAVASNSPISPNPNSFRVETGSNSNGVKWRGLFQFDLSTIPGNSSVTNALLVLLPQMANVVVPSSFNLYPVNQAWDELTVTWNTQPTFDATKVVNYSGSVYPNDMQYNITSIVSEWVSGVMTNNGVIIKNAESAINNYFLAISSDNTEITKRPKLIVTYNIPPSAPTVISPNGGEVWDSNQNITWIASTDSSTTQSNLKYHIQLSTDGGISWSDIVNLTTAGATSYSYDFSSSTETINALIRIRAMDDGNLYGPWDQSNAPFNIKHNTNPNTPTNTSPGGTSAALAVMIGSLTPTLTWTFSDPDVGNTQSAYKVTIYRTSDNVLISDSNWVNSTLKSYTVPTGKLSRGSAFYWRVQVKDNIGGISSLSANKYIQINRLPTVVVTSYTDGQSILDNLLTFTWTFNDLDSHPQTKYQIQGSKDNWATVAYNSGSITSSTSTHSSTFSQGEWDFRIRALDGYEWSGWANRNNLLLPSSFEPNDTSGTAFTIQHDQNYTTLISSTTDIDFYKFTSNQTGIDRVTLTIPTGKNYDLYIYDSSMNLIAAGPKLTGNEDVLVFVQSGQIYYVKVFGINSVNSTNPYTLRVENFGNINGSFHTDYQYDSNGNLTNKQTNIQ